MSELHTYQYDPTRTTTLRNAFVRNMRRRFNELTQAITQAIVEEDCFGISVKTQQVTTPGREAFNFPRSQDKVNAFLEWLRRQEHRGILETGTFTRIGEAAEEPWTNIYILDSYKRGVQRARYEMQRVGYSIPGIEASGGIDIIMSQPIHVDRVGLLYSRVFEDLKGITSQMDTQISRVLSRGLVDGDNPRLLARKLVATVNGKGAGELGITDELGRYIPARRRAEILARTECVRSHHTANMAEYRNWQAEGIKIRAEWVTAGDSRVCDECAGMEGRTFTLDEAEHMIPRHPQCRCIALPV